MRAKDEIAALKQTLAKRDEEVARLKAQPAAPASRGYEPPPAADEGEERAEREG